MHGAGRRSRCLTLGGCFSYPDWVENAQVNALAAVFSRIVRWECSVEQWCTAVMTRVMCTYVQVDLHNFMEVVVPALPEHGWDICLRRFGWLNMYVGFVACRWKRADRNAMLLAV